MRQTHFPGTRDSATADQPRRRNGVVRRAKRSGYDRRAGRREQPGDGVNSRHFERFVFGEHRQYRRQAAGKHRFSRAGGTDQQTGMRASRRDFERAFGHVLADDIREVGAVIRRRCDSSGVREFERVVAQRVDQLPNRSRDDERHGSHKRGLGDVRLGNDKCAHGARAQMACD